MHEQSRNSNAPLWFFPQQQETYNVHKPFDLYIHELLYLFTFALYDGAKDYFQMCHQQPHGEIHHFLFLYMFSASNIIASLARSIIHTGPKPLTFLM